MLVFVHGVMYLCHICSGAVLLHDVVQAHVATSAVSCECLCCSVSRTGPGRHTLSCECDGSVSVCMRMKLARG